MEAGGQKWNRGVPLRNVGDDGLSIPGSSGGSREVVVEKRVNSRNIFVVSWHNLLVGSSCDPSYCSREDGHVGRRDKFIRDV